MQHQRTVRLRVGGHIAEYLPGEYRSGGGDRELTLAGPRTVAEILADLGVPAGLVMAVSVGGRREPLSYVPADGDELTLLSPPAGG